MRTMWRRSYSIPSPHAEQPAAQAENGREEAPRNVAGNISVAGLQEDNNANEEWQARRPSADIRRMPPLPPNGTSSAAARSRYPENGSVGMAVLQQHSPNFGAMLGASPNSPMFAPRQAPAPPPSLDSSTDGDSDLTPHQLVDIATVWAQRNNFSSDQLAEFGHLMQMVAITYIPRWQVTQYRELDRGSFGTIYEALYDGTPVAVKQLSSDGSQIQSRMREVVLELQILGKIFPGHPNVVTFWGTAASFPRPTGKPYLGLIFELCSNGSLFKTLHQGGKGSLTFKDKMRLAIEISKGMGYLHSKGIIHRDLNSRNVLLDANMRAKVADFGCARKLKGAVLVTTTISGTAAYMAPEQLEGRDLTDKIDVWAYGVLLWELIAEQCPWAKFGNDLSALKKAVIQQNERLPSPAPEMFPAGERNRSQYVRLMDMSWSAPPQNRPTMVEVARTLERLRLEPVSVGEFL